MSQGEKGKRIKNAGSGNFRRRHFCVKGYCSPCTAITCAAGRPFTEANGAPHSTAVSEPPLGQNSERQSSAASTTAASRLAAGDIIRFVSIVFLLSVSNFGLSVTDLYSVYHRLVTTWSQIEKICTHLTDFLRGEVNIKMMIKIK